MPRPPAKELVEAYNVLVALPTRYTTANGNIGGTSLVDAGLIGAGVNSFFTMLIIIQPGNPLLVDSSDITAFNNATGEITFNTAYKGGQVLAGTPYKICPFRFVTAEVATLTALVTALNTTVDNTEQETEWAVGSSVEQVAAAAATNLTTISVTPVFPTGSTRIRAILIASIHLANQAANTHHVNFKVQGQRDGGGWVDLLDLTAQDSLGLSVSDATVDGWTGAIDVTALVNTSNVQYDFRFVVDSDNAGPVIYTQNFALVLVYTH